MKVELKTAPKPLFAPVTISITFTSQAELDAFGSLFNYVSVAKYCEANGISAPDIYLAIESAGGNIHATGRVALSLS